MIFLDTGYFIALLNARDELHERAVQWSQLVREPLLVTEQVLWETVNYFSAPIDRPKVHALLSHIQLSPDFETIPASVELLSAGLALHKARPDKEWTLTDCVSFVVMNERGLSQALAFDHHFEQAGFIALLRHAPSKNPTG